MGAMRFGGWFKNTYPDLTKPNLASTPIAYSGSKMAFGEM